MKRSIIVSVLLLCTLNQAYASHPQVNFRDMVRPHGHKRSAAIGNAMSNSAIAKPG